MWFNPNSRGSRLRIWQPWGCKSLHAHQPSLEAQQEQGCRAGARSAQAGVTVHRHASARQAISRRLASAGTADPGDLKSPSLPGASPGSPTNLRWPSYGLASRRVVNREQQTGSTQDRTALGVRVSPRRSAFAKATAWQASLRCPATAWQATLECQPDKRAGPVC